MQDTNGKVDRDISLPLEWSLLRRPHCYKLQPWVQVSNQGGSGWQCTTRTYYYIATIKAVKRLTIQTPGVDLINFLAQIYLNIFTVYTYKKIQLTKSKKISGRKVLRDPHLLAKVSLRISVEKRWLNSTPSRSKCNLAERMAEPVVDLGGVAP